MDGWMDGWRDGWRGGAKIVIQKRSMVESRHGNTPMVNYILSDTFKPSGVMVFNVSIQNFSRSFG